MRLVGHRVGVRLVHDDYPPVAAQPIEPLVHDARGVGRVAHHDQVGGLRHVRRVQHERRFEHQLVDRPTSGVQRVLRPARAGVHAERPPRPQRPGEQDERLVVAGREQHLGRVPVVPPGHGAHRPGPVGHDAEAVQAPLEPAAQPRRRALAADVPGEVQRTRHRSNHCRDSRSRTTSPTTVVTGARRPASRTSVASCPSVLTTTRCSAIVPCWMQAAGVVAGRP